MSWSVSKRRSTPLAQPSAGFLALAVGDVEGRTTALAATLLRHAGAGEFAERLHTLLAALLGSDDEAIPAAIDRAVAWGATSGTDCLFGVLVGLDVAAGVRRGVGLMSPVQARIFPNSYRDSVELMQIAAELESLAGIDRAGLVMATPANREVLAAAGLLSDATASAGPNDLVVAVASDDESAATRRWSEPRNDWRGRAPKVRARRPARRRGRSPKPSRRPAPTSP